ncbi:hypothetical protein [Frankia tisae]|nr:hypothetical protein [Frankia tisae]
MTAQAPERTLGAIAHGEAPVFEEIVQMHLDTLARSDWTRS